MLAFVVLYSFFLVAVAFSVLSNVGTTCTTSRRREAGQAGGPAEPREFGEHGVMSHGSSPDSVLLSSLSIASSVIPQWGVVAKVTQVCALHADSLKHNPTLKISFSFFVLAAHEVRHGSQHGCLESSGLLDIW